MINSDQYDHLIPEMKRKVINRLYCVWNALRTKLPELIAAGAESPELKEAIEKAIISDA